MDPTILYVDDQQENLDGFRFTFRKDFNIYTALNAAEGLRILEENEISIVISDQRMPEILGTEFLNEVALKFPHSIRIILTAFADFNAVVGAINKGQVYRFLTKPWNRDEMRMTIENAHEAYLLRKENVKLIHDLREVNENLNSNNKLLQQEIEERKIIEAELQNHRDNLEIIVKDRTKELASSNEELKTLNESFRTEIEKRKQTEKLLAESETKFRSFIEQSAEGIIIADREGNIIEANQSTMKIFAVTREELIQGNIWNIQSRFIPVNSRNEDAMNRTKLYINNFFQADDIGKSFIMEGYYDEDKEDKKYIQGNLFKIESNNQQYIGLTARDLTEKKKSEEELQKHKNHLEELVELRTRELLTTEARLQSLSDNLPGGAIFRGFIDQHGMDHMVYGSKGIEVITGVTVEKLKENMNYFFQRIHAEDIALFLHARIKSRESLTSLDIVFRYIKENDEIRWIQIRIVYSKSNDETVWWDGYAMDITDRKKSEEQLKEREIIFKNLQELIAPVTGEKLFDTLLLNIEEILHTYSLFVAEYIPEAGIIRTLSFSREREIHSNFEYPIKGTPTEKVLSDGMVAYTSNIAQAFPTDQSLVNEKINGYVGVALTDSTGKSIGVMVAGSRNIISNLEFALQILRVFSVRIGAELMRLQKDRELKEREERFSTLFDLSPNMQIITGMDGKIVEANSTFLQYTGLSREETIGRSTVELKLWDKDDSAHLDEEFRRNGKLNNFAAYFIPKKGKKRHVLLSQAPITIKGKPYAISTGIDITERIQAEQKLVQSEERFRSILQNLSDSIWITDDKAKIIYQSPSALDMLGYKEGELHGKTGLDLIHPEDLPIVVKDFADAVNDIESGTPTLFRMRTATGTYIYVEGVASNKLEDPAIRGIIVTLRNVTEKIFKDKALRASEQKFRNIFNNSTDAIIISTLDQKILEVNDVVLTLSGFRREELLAKTTTELATEKSKQKINRRFSKIATGELVPATEIEFLVRSGEILNTEMTSRLIDYEGGKALLTLIRDITERKKLEKKLIDTIIQTEEKERERMAADLHDEVGPLLSSMKMYLNSLVETKDAAKSLYIADQLQLLIKESINAVREISNDLSPHILNNYGLSAAVRATIETQMQFIHINLKENLENRRFSSNIEIIFYRIIRELINNTIKHASAKKIEIRMVHREERMILYYSDDGSGFDWQLVINSPRKGLGLMNIISRVKSMNGHYNIQTSPGKGFNFELSAPL